MMRRMRAAGDVVDKERLVRRQRVNALHVRDGVVRLRRGQIPSRMADIRIDCGSVAEQVRLPLAGGAADESIEVLKTHADGRLVEGGGRAGLVWCGGAGL